MNFSLCIPVGAACKTQEQQAGNSGEAEECNGSGLRLADLGREDSIAGETLSSQCTARSVCSQNSGHRVINSAQSS